MARVGTAIVGEDELHARHLTGEAHERSDAPLRLVEMVLEGDEKGHLWLRAVSLQAAVGKLATTR